MKEGRTSMPNVQRLETDKMGIVYEIKNDSGVKLVTSPEGARLLDWVVPVDGGRDLVVGYDTIKGHQEARYYGATIGPVAGRIAGTHFTIDGKEYQTEDNDGGNTLHGGSKGLDTDTWAAETFETATAAGVIYRTHREDGAGGFPGNVDYTVTYTLENDDSFTITYDAQTDQPTLFNPTNHGYFNLTGDTRNPIDDHLVQINAEYVAETNPDVTTTGRKHAVADTKFDFREARKVGTTLLDDPFLLDHTQDWDLKVTSPDEKVAITVTTDRPAVVIYTTREGEAGSPMKTGPFANHGGMAIETQGVPGTEKYPQFGDIVLRPETPYHSVTRYQAIY
jgi:aldose 1-epimerase